MTKLLYTNIICISYIHCVMWYFISLPECTVNFFLSGGICTECPGNSSSTGGTSESCTCDSNFVTLSGGSSTTSDTCICQANYYVDSSDMCVRCPANSEREVSSPDSSCMCVERHQTPGGQSVTSGDVACSGKSANIW